MNSAGKQMDVIVIGAGIMGSSTAYNAAKRGQKTLLLERFDFLHHNGSSHGESRTLRATYPEDYYSAMVIESSKLWQEAESEIGYKVYYEAPQLDMGHATNKSLRAVVASCEKNELTHRVLDRRQVREVFSGLVDLPEDWIAVVTGLGGVIKPTKAVAMYQSLAIKHGAVLRDKIEAVDLKFDGQRGGISVISRNGEEFWGKKCVITAGAWTRKLIQNSRGIDLPIQPLETSVFYWRIKPGHELDFSINGGFPTFASYGEPYIYGTPSLEFPGLVKIAVHGGRECDPDERSWTPAATELDALREWIGGRFGHERVDTSGPVMTQSCMYSMTPDEDFVIDYLGGEFGEDVVIGGGFSGHGFKMAPVVGRLLAEMAIDGEARALGETMKHFRLKRFQETITKGNVKDFDDQVSKLRGDYQ